MDIIKLVRSEEKRIIEYRRYFHENPELAGLEDNTVAFICKELDSFGIPYVNVDKGGVLATIDSGKEGKTLLLRADIDALPIEEDPCNFAGKPKPVVSKVKGVQHACGHDGHTAMLLVAGKILNEIKDQFVGKIILCFERGEEAAYNVRYLLDYMVKENIKIDAGFGMHISVQETNGEITIQSGPLMAGMMVFDIKLIGKGGHGSRPDQSSNPIDCFAAIHKGIADMRMTRINPFEPLTYSICNLHAGSKANIIPDELSFSGTVRYYNLEDVAYRFREGMLEVVEETAKIYHCKAEYRTPSGSLPNINNDVLATIARDGIGKLFESDIIEGEPWMGSESFAYYSLLFPTVFIFLGVGNEEKGILAGVHTSKHDLDEDQLYKGSCAHIAYALEYLNRDINIDHEKTERSIKEIFEELGYPIS